ncbi:hypothetical protein [Nocardioides sp. R-C-SC26]|uniref:DUF6912 family protein n=1 Tax=Nocardioides sp. R-C-SC26 TaxID=2870414 RepID=UPI001E531D9E|nr:hypothetical protein [Nocardioides sp. R-C-SC26]
MSAATRLYVPVTVEELRSLAEAGTLDVVLDDAVVAESDAEDDEYAALMTAADLSAERLAGAPGRRIVVVVELDPAAVGGGAIGAIRLRDVVALHADGEVRPADGDPDEDLGWYATQEIAALLG